MGALPGSETWQQFKYGMGPVIDGLFAQSNFGVVTKMGFWLMPEPEAALSVTVSVPHHDDFARFADILIGLIYAGLVQSQTQIFSPVLQMPPDAELAALRARWDDGRVAALDAYAARKNLPFWSAPITFYGPAKVIQAQWEHVKERFSVLPGVSSHEAASFKFPLTDEQVEAVADKARLGIPSLALFASRRAPGVDPLEGHMDFSPIVPMRGDAILKALNAFGKLFSDLKVFPLGGLPLFYHTRTVTLIYAIPTGRDPATNQRARDAFERAIELGAAHGWGEYRIHPAFMDKARSFYGFNDNALLRFHERLKDAVDPNGILSAGRYGIWPKHLRKPR